VEVEAMPGFTSLTYQFTFVRVHRKIQPHIL
jgi:hypothetical protein